MQMRRRKLAPAKCRPNGTVAVLKYSLGLVGGLLGYNIGTIALCCTIIVAGILVLACSSIVRSLVVRREWGSTTALRSTDEIRGSWYSFPTSCSQKTRNTIAIN